MANFFDQFDPPEASSGGNFFDQFDEPAAQKGGTGNFFDRFDTVPDVQLPKPSEDFLKRVPGLGNGAPRNPALAPGQPENTPIADRKIINGREYRLGKDSGIVFDDKNQPVDDPAIQQAFGIVPQQGMLDRWVLNPLGRGKNQSLDPAYDVGMFLSGQSTPEDFAKGIVSNYEQSKAYPQDPRDAASMAEYQKANGFLESIGVLARNPNIIGQTSVESLPAMGAMAAGSLAGGLAGGAAGSVVPVVGTAAGGLAGSIAGTGMASGYVEFSNSLTQALAETGKPVTPENVLAAINDPAIMSAAKDKALKRGVSIGVFDALSAGIAGRIGKPVEKLVGGTAGRVAGAGTEVVGQGLAGAGGEAAGQIASEGQITRPGDVVLEGAAELATGPIEIGSAILGREAPNAVLPGQQPATPPATRQEPRLFPGPQPGPQTAGPGAPGAPPPAAAQPVPTNPTVTATPSDDILAADGYSPAQIADMTPDERRAALESAVARGVTTAAPAPTAPPAAETPPSASAGPAQAPPAPGTAPMAPRMRPTPAAPIAPTGPAIQHPPGPAIWANLSHDEPVTILDEPAQPGNDGKYYQPVTDMNGNRGYLAEDELRPQAPTPSSTPQAAQPSQGPGSELPNGFRAGPRGNTKYRVTPNHKTLGGKVLYEKRSETGQASSFYVGNDGNMVDADTVNVRGNDRDRLWTPNSEEARSKVAELLDRRGQIELNSPEDVALKDQIRQIVLEDQSGPGAPRKSAPADDLDALLNDAIAQEFGGQQQAEAPAPAPVDPAVVNRQLEEYIAGKKPLTQEAFAKHAGIDVNEAGKALQRAHAANWIYLGPKGYRRHPTRVAPLDVLEFVAAKGGVSDPTGELKALDLHKPKYNSPSYGPVVRRTGMHPDKMREALIDAGYIRDAGRDAGGQLTSTVADFYDVMGRAAGGEKIYAEMDKAKAAGLEAERKNRDLKPADWEDRHPIETRYGPEVWAAMQQFLAETGSHEEAWATSEINDAARMIADGVDPEDAFTRAADTRILDLLDHDNDFAPEITAAFQSNAANAKVAFEPPPFDLETPTNAEQQGPYAPGDGVRTAGEDVQDGEGQAALSGPAAQVRDTGAGSPEAGSAGADAGQNFAGEFDGVSNDDFIANIEGRIADGENDVYIAPTADGPEFRTALEARGWKMGKFGRKGKAFYSPARDGYLFYDAAVADKRLNVQFSPLKEKDMADYPDFVTGKESSPAAEPPKSKQKKSNVAASANENGVLDDSNPVQTIKEKAGSAKFSINVVRDENGKYSTSYDYDLQGQSGGTSPAFTARDRLHDTPESAIAAAASRILRQFEYDFRTNDIPDSKKRDLKKVIAKLKELGGKSGEAVEEAPTPTTEKGADNKEQLVIPGAEQDRKGALQNAAEAPLKAKAPQKGMDVGIFGSEKDQTDLFDKPKPNSASTKPNSASSETNPAKIEDFGEKILGARKDAVRDIVKSLEDDVDVAVEPLSKTFPQPDYEKLAASGVDRKALALIASMREYIPSKPRQSWKLKDYVSKVTVMRGFAQKLLKGEVTADEILAKMKSAEFRTLIHVANTADVISAVEPKLLPYAAQYKIRSGGVSMLRGERFSPAKHIYYLEDPKGRWLDIDSETLDGVRDAAVGYITARAEKELGAKGTVERRTPLNLYQDRHTKEYFIGFKGVRGVIRLKAGFEKGREAREYMRDHADELQAQIDQMREGPDLRRASNMPRKGPFRREGDATPALFDETFGFRGVQFGNYVEGDRRQSDLNEAFDALMDMADALGIPPKALSLDGRLGLAFGARGHGGKNAAAAHYEPTQIVINLTKHAGPGSLAHEWLHALDHYFSRQNGAGEGRAYISEAKQRGDVREPVWQAWKDLEKAISRGPFAVRSDKLDEAKSKPYYGTTIEKAARSFEKYIVDRLNEKQTNNDYLANIELSSGAYPLDEEMQKDGIRKAFDDLFASLDVRWSEDKKKAALFSAPRRQAPLASAPRGQTGSEFAADFMSELAQNDKLFQNPVSSSSTLEKVISDIAPDIEARGKFMLSEADRQNGVVSKKRFLNEDGYDFFVLEDGDRQVWIDISGFATGMRGSGIYAAVANYAHNAGKVFIGDPAGLSDDALLRRTEAMLSSALKFGTTRHIEPHPRQLQGAPEIGVPPLKWTYGNDAANVGSLIEASTSNLLNAIPELADARYDFSTRTFRDAAGRPLSDETFDKWRLAASRAGKARAGNSTLRRGILLNTLSRAASGDRPRLLEQALRFQRSLVDSGGLRGLLYSTPKAPTFYSGLLRAVEGMKQEKAPKTQWMGMIRNAPGVKPEEIAWIGLEDWLSQQNAAITKQQLVDFIKANQVEVKEVTKSETLDYSDDLEVEQNELGEYVIINMDTGNPVGGSFSTEEEALEARAELSEATGDATKYHGYQLPGGDNYRELLITLPDAASKVSGRPYHIVRDEVMKPALRRVLGSDAVEDYLRRYAFLKDKPSDVLEEVRPTAESVIQRLNEAGEGEAVRQYFESFKVDASIEEARKNEYRSTHWDEKNILTHIRFNERTDKDGKKVLFVEEIQSDWHQKGRKEGYKLTEASKAAIRQKMGALEATIEAQGFDATPEQQKAWGDLHGELTRTDGVPDAPFKTTWPELAMKRVIRWAAENGFDRVAWTPGEVQAERYDLSKHIDAIAYQKRGDSYGLEIRQKGAFENRSIGEHTAEQLEAQVGKELADKIVKGEGKTVGFYGADKGWKVLDGLDLKIGGSGMKGFYDKMLVDVANRLGKKFGTKVSVSRINAVVEGKYDIRPLNSGSWELVDDMGRRLPESPVFRSGAAAQDWLAANIGTNAPSIEITPAMREAAMQGQPLFKKKVFTNPAPWAPGKPVGIIEKPKLGQNPYQFVLSKKQAAQLTYEVGQAAERILGHHVVSIDLYDEMPNGQNPHFDPNTEIIKMALKCHDDPRLTLRHEAIHLLRQAGVFSAHEWAILARQAKARWIEQYDIRSRYEQMYRESMDITPDQLEELMIEEAVADAFAEHWVGGNRGEDVISRVFEKIKQFLEAVANLARGHGFKTADSIMSATESGSVGQRQRDSGQDRGFTPYAKQQSAPRSISAKTMVDLRAKIYEAERWTREAGESQAERIKASYDVKFDQKNNRITATKKQAPLYNVPADDGGRVGSLFGGPTTAEEDRVLEDFAGNINLTKIDGPESLKDVLREASDQADGFIGARRGVVSHDQTRMLAEQMGMTVRQLLSRRKGQAFNAHEAFAARAMLVKSAELVKQAAARVQRTRSDVDRAYFMRMMTRHAAIQEQVAGMTAEAGRALNQFKMMAGPDYLRSVTDALNERSINGHIGNNGIDDLAGMVDSMEQPGQVERISRDLYRPGFLDMIREFYINALLSGPATQTVNFMSNLLTAVNQIPEQLLAEQIGKLHGGEKVQKGEAFAKAVGLLEGSREGMRLAWATLKTGEQHTPETQFDQRTGKAIPGVTGEIVRLPSRFMMSSDDFFKAINYRAELNALAVRQAKSEGLTGQQLAARIQELRDDPTDDMIRKSQENARYQTFQNKLGPKGQLLIRFREAWHLWPILPFLRTGINIMRYAAERTPLAPLLMKDARERLLGRKGKVAQDIQISRMVLGTVVMTGMASMVLQGMVTGGGPDDDKEKDVWRGTGWQPYSYHPGNTYYSYIRFDPFALHLGVVADMIEMREKFGKGAYDQVAYMLAASIVNNITEKTWLRSGVKFTEMLTDPKRFMEKFAGDFITGFVPNISAQTARTNDPSFRDARTIIDRIKERIPGQKETLPQRFDLFGNPVVGEGNLGPDLLSPVYMSKDKDNPVAKALIAASYFPGLPRRNINGHDLTPQQYAEYSEAAGKEAVRRLSEIVQAENWSKRSQEQQERVLKQGFDKARELVRNRLMAKYPELRKKAAATP